MALKLLQISISLPISTASCKRSFSCLKCLKNWLKSIMGHERLMSFAIISIERDSCSLIVSTALLLNESNVMVRHGSYSFNFMIPLLSSVY